MNVSQQGAPVGPEPDADRGEGGQEPQGERHRVVANGGPSAPGQVTLPEIYKVTYQKSGIMTGGRSGTRPPVMIAGLGMRTGPEPGLAHRVVVPARLDLTRSRKPDNTPLLP
ncbi:hypothetical protein GCM10009733_046800 [Nonomuraea maheshkhaliensis]|uniref:Uncharacterized protein n=1 Tax=Nonomuraea maheshkhaliensis TaxID=419590 RepID=A0ABP4RF22_9ACTN